MKPKNVHRGISSLPKNQSPGYSAPRVGKLGKIHRNYEKVSHRSRRQQQSAADLLFRQYLNYFLILTGAVLVGGVLWMTYTQVWGKKQSSLAIEFATETFEVPKPSKAECIQMTSALLNASTAEEFKNLLYYNRVPADDAMRLVSLKKKELGDILAMEWGGAEDMNGLTLERVFLTLKEERYHSVFLRHDNAGRWHIDLDSFLLHATKPWDEIYGKNSCQAVIRATMTSDYYYNGLFANEVEWICISLLPAGQTQKLYGYIHPDTANFRAIIEILKTENPAPVMVEISRDAGMEPLQFEIKSVVAQGWVESDKIFSLEFDSAAKKKLEASQLPP